MLTLISLLLTVTPAERVDAFVRAEHGARGTTSADRQPFRDDPGGHLPTLLAYLDPVAVSNDDDFQRRRYAANAAGILARECGAKGQTALLDVLKRLKDLRLLLLDEAAILRAALPKQYTDQDREPLQKVGRRIDRLLSAEGAALYAFAFALDPRAVDHVLARLEKDFDLQLVSIDYLQAVAPKDPKVQSAVAALEKSTTSPMIRARLKGFN